MKKRQPTSLNGWRWGNGPPNQEHSQGQTELNTLDRKAVICHYFYLLAFKFISSEILAPRILMVKFLSASMEWRFHSYLSAHCSAFVACCAPPSYHIPPHGCIAVGLYGQLSTFCSVGLKDPVQNVNTTTLIYRLLAFFDSYHVCCRIKLSRHLTLSKHLHD